MNPSQTSTNGAASFSISDLLGSNSADPATSSGDNGMIGTPYQDIQEWDGQQTASDDCAVRAQQFIIEQFTGQKLSEQSLEQEAQSKGWYNPGNGGTPLADMGNLLEAHGIPVQTYDHASISDLESQLRDGHKVIIGVNAEDLWSHDPALQGIVQASGSQGADHAVVVSGIDDSDPNNVKVIISDPGTGEATASYPLNDFLNAWKASDFTMVATKEADPDYEAMHATPATANDTTDTTTPADTTTPTDPSDPTDPTTLTTPDQHSHDTTPTDPTTFCNPEQNSHDTWMPYNFLPPMENFPGMENLPGMETLPGAWDQAMGMPTSFFMENPEMAFEAFQQEMSPEALAFEQQAYLEYEQYEQPYDSSPPHGY
jgi:hypothetical protein